MVIGAAITGGALCVERASSMARKREEVVGDGIHSGDRIVGGYHDGCELW